MMNPSTAVTRRYNLDVCERILSPKAGTAKEGRAKRITRHG